MNEKGKPMKQMVEVIKNFFKIILIAALGLVTAMSVFPLKGGEYLLLFTVPFWIFVGSYCYTYKTTPEAIVEKWMNRK